MSLSFEAAFEFTRLEAGWAAGEGTVPEGIVFHSLLCRVNICCRYTDTKRHCIKSYPIPEEQLLRLSKATELKDATDYFQPLVMWRKLRQPGCFHSLPEP